jgi:hypothetical protein
MLRTETRLATSLSQLVFGEMPAQPEQRVGPCGLGFHGPKFLKKFLVRAKNLAAALLRSPVDFAGFPRALLMNVSIIR